MISEDEKLAWQMKALKAAEYEKENLVKRGLSNIKAIIGRTRERVKQLQKQQKSLELKGKEMDILRDLHAKREDLLDKLPSLKDSELQEMILLKEEEVAELQEKLKMSEMEKEVSDNEEELYRLMSELNEASTNVKRLQETYARTKQELDLKREKVDRFLMQQTAAKLSDDRHRREIEVREQYTCSIAVNFMNTQ